MKRLCVVLFFFAMKYFSMAAAETVSPSLLQELDLNDCNVMRIFARVWKYSPLVQKERAVWVIHSDGKYSAIDWLHTPQNRITVWSAPLPDHIVAQAHTHGDHLDPRPSDEDVQVAQRLNIWVYTLTRRGIWRAAPDGIVSQQANLGWYDETTKKCGSDQK